MKKLMTILVVFALCGVAMAASGSSTVSGTDSAIKQIPLTTGEHEYINFKKESSTTQGTSGLTYTVVASKTNIPSAYYQTTQKNIIGYERKWSLLYGWYDAPIYETVNVNVPYKYDSNHTIGQLYFTTASQAELDAYNAEHSAETGKTMSKVVVQFAGTQMDKGTSKMVQDYGIYLYDPDTNEKSAWMSVNSANGVNYFELNPDETFGVYYVTKDGDYITTTDNWIGNFDQGNNEQKPGTNAIIEYDDAHPDGNPTYTYKKFMCLFTTDEPYLNDIVHWEFMLQTQLDDPYYNVHYEDFGGNGETFNNEPAPAGQPLPGTFATLLIGSFCAVGLRKKNKK